jgi:hypothetical protein
MAVHGAVQRTDNRGIYERTFGRIESVSISQLHDSIRPKMRIRKESRGVVSKANPRSRDCSREFSKRVELESSPRVRQKWPACNLSIRPPALLRPLHGRWAPNQPPLPFGLQEAREVLPFDSDQPVMTIPRVACVPSSSVSRYVPMRRNFS